MATNSSISPEQSNFIHHVTTTGITDEDQATLLGALHTDPDKDGWLDNNNFAWELGKNFNNDILQQASVFSAVESVRDAIRAASTPAEPPVEDDDDSTDNEPEATTPEEVSQKMFANLSPVETQIALAALGNIGVLRADIQRLEDTVATGEEDAQRLRDEISDKESKITELRQDILDLEARYAAESDAKDLAIADLNTDIGTLTTERDQAEADRAAAEGHLTTATAALKAGSHDRVLAWTPETDLQQDTSDQELSADAANLRIERHGALTRKKTIRKESLDSLNNGGSIDAALRNITSGKTRPIDIAAIFEGSEADGNLLTERAAAFEQIGEALRTRLHEGVTLYETLANTKADHADYDQMIADAKHVGKQADKITEPLVTDDGRAVPNVRTLLQSATPLDLITALRTIQTAVETAHTQDAQQTEEKARELALQIDQAVAGIEAATAADPTRVNLRTADVLAQLQALQASGVSQEFNQDRALAIVETRMTALLDAFESMHEELSEKIFTEGLSRIQKGSRKLSRLKKLNKKKAGIVAVATTAGLAAVDSVFNGAKILTLIGSLWGSPTTDPNAYNPDNGGQQGPVPEQTDSNEVDQELLDIINRNR